MDSSDRYMLIGDDCVVMSNIKSLKEGFSQLRLLSAWYNKLILVKVIADGKEVV